jgi:glycosyltransferase involved in cell wall biosynthesis
VALFQITKNQNSDIIHAHWVIPNGLIASIVSKLRKIPFIISLHGSDMFLARRNLLYGYISKWIFQNASGVTACSPDLKKIALSIETNQNVELIPWGADPNLFKRAHHSSLNRERVHPISVELIITSLGRLVHKKGFNILLEAFSHAIKEIPQLKLIIGGDGPNRDALFKKSVDLGLENDVKFVGNVPWDSVPYFLSQSDIFILPSIVDPRGNVDGLPTVLLEAMSCENAVIASDIGGVSMVIDNYKTGILIKPGGIEQLTNSILILAKDKEFRIRLGSEARKSVIENFNWQNTAKKIEEIIIQVVTQ